MKKIPYFAILFIASIMPFLSASAITADELARYLGVSSVSTTVALPPLSFVVQLYSIEDGEVGRCLSEGGLPSSQYPEKGLLIMWGTENGKYRFVFAYGDGTTETVQTDVPAELNFIRIGKLSATIKAGDYLLFGQSNFKSGGATEIASISKGFLLRIKRTSTPLPR